jgi:hypothetical protein
MKKLLVLTVCAVLLALMVPAAVSAAGVFYCSTTRASGGNGTYNDPWACGTNEQFNWVVYDQICYRYGGGHLYRTWPGSYVYYRIDWIAERQTCEITYQSEHPGYPPYTGAEFPVPLILGGAAAVGVLFLGAGLALRRRKTA